MILLEKLSKWKGFLLQDTSLASSERIQTCESDGQLAKSKFLSIRTQASPEVKEYRLCIEDPDFLRRTHILSATLIFFAAHVLGVCEVDSRVRAHAH